jgi:hypothetical protein
MAPPKDITIGLYEMNSFEYELDAIASSASPFVQLSPRSPRFKTPQPFSQDSN